MNRQLISFIFASLLFAGIPNLTLALIVEIDDNPLGQGALTRDTDQGLEFLDLTLTQGRSVDDITSQLSPGGEFHGFRYATTSEVATLVNNYGFSPGAIGGYPVSATGDLGVDQLSGLVALLGITHVSTSPDSNWAQGKTASETGCAVPVLTIRDFSNHPTLGDDDTFGIAGCTNSSSTAASLGNFLVRSAPTGNTETTASLIELFPGQFDNTKYRIQLTDPEGFCEFLVSVNPTSGCPQNPSCGLYGGSGNGFTTVTSSTVTTPVEFYPLTWWASDCSGNFAEGIIECPERQCGIPVPVFACAGFDSPLDESPVTVRNNRALPFKAQIIDDQGFEIDDTNIPSLPVIQVHYSDGTSPAIDVTSEALPAGQGSDGNQFEYQGSHWQFNLLTRNYSAPGSYTVTIESGDSEQYLLEPQCSATFVIE